MKRCVRVLTVTAVIVLLAVTSVSASGDGGGNAKDNPQFRNLSPEALVKKYGKPDEIDSTEHDSPRPPLVMKWIVYERDRVQFVYVPDAKINTPPPYKKWILAKVIDPADKSDLSFDEASRRMTRGPEATAAPPTAKTTPVEDDESRYMMASNMCAVATMNSDLGVLDRPILCNCVAKRVEASLKTKKRASEEAEFQMIKRAVIAQLPSCLKQLR